MSEEPTASCGHVFDMWSGFGVCPHCDAEKYAKIEEQAQEIERLKEKVETLKVRLNAYYGECKPCSRCQGTGKDPEIKNCTCDCCEGTGWEVDA